MYLIEKNTFVESSLTKIRILMHNVASHRDMTLRLCFCHVIAGLPLILWILTESCLGLAQNACLAHYAQACSPASKVLVSGVLQRKRDVIAAN
jgi:hypothetical protein